MVTEFQQKVYSIVKKIPRGKTMTYKQVAEKLNSSPRAVARALSRNPTPVIVPCHRVICSNGTLGGYTYNGKRNDKMKIKLLKEERKNKY